ncbi:MAG: FtsX-like permease family protein, partial [Oscillospiraceae bacterium]
ISGATHTFYVVGVYEYKTGSGMFSYAGASTNLYIPISTAKRINNANTNFANITVVAGVGEGSDALAQDLNHFFDRQYKNNPRFYAQGYSMQSMVESTTKTFKTISMAISVIAGISLLVGGIGVMNIMLVSITERTREIGTRKALGATNGSIRFQFIVESVIICLVGGTIGIILGVGLGTIGSKLVGYAARPSFTSIFIAVGFSMAIGIFFGYYPANKAAKLDPIEALRYE